MWFAQRTFLYWHKTERHGRVVNTCFVFGRSRVQISARRPVIMFSWFYSVTPGEFRDSTLKLGHGRFLSNSFQFIIHLSYFHSTLYGLRFWKTSLNELQTNWLAGSQSFFQLYFYLLWERSPRGALLMCYRINRNVLNRIWSFAFHKIREMSDFLTQFFGLWTEHILPALRWRI
jgi:hypothetical protein